MGLLPFVSALINQRPGGLSSAQSRSMRVSQPGSALGRYAMSYPSTHERKLFISAAEFGNVLRCINHSAAAHNVCTVPVFCPLSGITQVAVVASADIAKGGQLLLDYGPAYWRLHGQWHLGAEAQY